MPWRDNSTNAYYIPVILLLVAVFYGIIPAAGAFFNRYRWKQFRNRFNALRLEPVLDYRQYRKLKNEEAVFRFTGGIESLTDGKTLWVKGEDLTIPVSLENTKCWLLPFNEENEVPETPEKIRWNQVSALTEGVKVFIGGLVKMRNNRPVFSSTRENPLTIIFYNCSETELTGCVTRAARSRNEYWNTITPVSLAVGALSLVFLAYSFLARPAFRLTVIASLVAVFVPVFPLIPPGFLLTSIYRRLSWHARNSRAYSNLCMLPLAYLKEGTNTCVLATGETYGYIKAGALPEGLAEREDIPFLVPEWKKDKKQNRHIFGVFEGNNPVPSRSKDPFVSYGLLPDWPAVLSRRYAGKALAQEALAWLVLITGIIINIVFIMLIISIVTGI